jgi:hypothetical protein
MADYYSLLAKAVANLPNKSMPSARRAIYERARKALIGQLRTLEPALAEADVKREETALDAAIQRLEALFLAAPVAVPTQAAAPPIASSGAAPVGHPPTAKPILSPPRAPAPPASGAAAPPAPRAPIAPPLRRPAPAQPNAPAETPPQIQTSFPNAPAPVAAAPPIVAHDQAVGDDRYAPAVAPPAFSEPLSPPLRAANGASRPSAPRQGETQKRSIWPLIGLAVLVGIVAAVAFAAIQLRQKPQDLAIKEPEAATQKAEDTAQNKVVQRVPAAGAPSPVAEPPAPAASPSPSTTPTPSIESTPTPAATPTPAPSSTPAASSSQDQGAAAAAPVPSPAPNAPTDQATQQPNAPIAVAARAALLIAVASDPQKPAVDLGTVVWSLVPGVGGAGPSIRAEADIPDAKMHAVMTIQKNTVASLPATHTIDLRVTFADGSEIKGIKDMALPQLRRDDPPGADAVSGARAKINDNYFLVGLTKSDSDMAHNLDLIATRNWFDFPLLLNDDRIAKLTFEKAAEGDRIVSQALAAWK